MYIFQKERCGIFVVKELCLRNFLLLGQVPIYPDQFGVIIGTKGSTIRQIEEESKAKINTER